MSKRTLEEWLDQLERLHPQEIDLGLERTRAVAQRLGWGSDWRPAPQLVTVAGTNGKGSTLGLMEAMLVAAGIRVGTYSSPHLVRYNERVRINANPVADAALCAAFEQVERARQGTSLTYFEFGTLAAAWIIAEQKVEVALLEIGLGGRLDAVNLFDPDLAIITGIALDHMEWLGKDREAIGAEKAGILRPHAVAIIGDPDPPASVIAATREVEAQVVFAGKDFGVSGEPGQRAGWRGVRTSGQACTIRDLPASGAHPQAIASAVQAMTTLKPDQVTPEVVRTALQECTIPGRCQRFERHGQHFVVDVSHNPQAARYLAEAVQGRTGEQATGGTRRILIGMLRDKEIAGTIAPFIEWADEWICVDTPGGRGMPASELAAAVARQTAKPVTTASDPATALHQVLAAGCPGDQMVGFGSFSVAGGLIEAFAETGDS